VEFEVWVKTRSYTLQTIEEDLPQRRKVAKKKLGRANLRKAKVS